MTAPSAQRTILIIAGEPSGDHHAARLVTALRRRCPDLRFYGTGGDRMAAAGVTLLYHVRELAVLGLVEVVRHLRFFIRVRNRLLASLKKEQPCLVILVDYPGFNLRFARKLKERSRIPVVYYIAPQVWAWGKKRIPLMRRVIDLMLVILPFEKEFFSSHGISAEYVGHPLTEAVRPSGTKEEFCRAAGLDPARPILGLLPGSRRQEVEKILPVMAEAAERIGKKHPVQPVVAAADTIGPEWVQPWCARAGIPAVTGKTYDIMSYSDLVLTASGTATLETAWCRTPMIILYRVSPVTWFFGTRLVRLRHIGLVNIVADREIVPECLQDRMRPDLIAAEADAILGSPERQRVITENLDATARILGSGSASDAAATHIAGLLETV